MGTQDLQIKGQAPYDYFVEALIQPVLDYCSQLWSPHQAGDIQQLEAVQRAFTRKITGMGSYDY